MPSTPERQATEAQFASNRQQGGRLENADAEGASRVGLDRELWS